MNRIGCLLFVASFLFAAQSNAQLLRSVGVKVAINSASQKFDYANPPWPGFGQDLKRRTGINAAIFAEWLNLPFFSLVTQVEYAQRGFTQDFVQTGNDPTPIGTIVRNNRLEYVSVPVLLKLSTGHGLLSPYLFGGPRFDFLVGYKDSFLEINPINDGSKKSTYGGSLGVGVELRKVLPVIVSVEFRYDADFIDLYNAQSVKVRNSAYGFWLGVAL